MRNSILEIRILWRAHFSGTTRSATAEVIDGRGVTTLIQYRTVQQSIRGDQTRLTSVKSTGTGAQALVGIGTEMVPESAYNP